jgi:hypothetical protein
MVSQQMVEDVMKILDRPCTAKDIANYMRENKLSIIASEISYDISTVLNSLRKWYVVEKFPDLHGPDSNKWYLTSGENPHDSKRCQYCRGIEATHNGNTVRHMKQTAMRRTRLVRDKDHLAANEYEDGEWSGYW